jgi:hypothetical protein
MAKSLIAYALGRREEQPSITNTSGEHWLRLLGNYIVGDTLDAFPRRDIGIITFNYERSLERYLWGRLTATFGGRHPVSEIQAAFLRLPIVHIYGHLGHLPEFGEPQRSYQPLRNAQQLAVAIECMHLLPEIKRNDGAGQRHQAQELLRRATMSVSFLGFAYSDENLEALALTQTLGQKTVLGTFVGFVIGDPFEELTQRMGRHGIPVNWTRLERDNINHISLNVYESLHLHPRWLLGPDKLSR